MSLGTWLPVFALGAVPLAVWGFFTSAVANRPALAAWGAASAVAWTAAARMGLTRRWTPPKRAAVLCLTAAAAVTALAALLTVWAADLELGLRAVAPVLPAAPLSSPWGALGLAAGLALAGAVALALARRRETAA